MATPFLNVNPNVSTQAKFNLFDFTPKASLNTPQSIKTAQTIQTTPQASFRVPESIQTAKTITPQAPISWVARIWTQAQAEWLSDDEISQLIDEWYSDDEIMNLDNELKTKPIQQPQEQGFLESIKYKPYTPEEVTAFDPNKSTAQNLIEWQWRYAKNIIWWVYNILPWIAQLWTWIATWVTKDMYNKIGWLFWMDTTEYEKWQVEKTNALITWIAKDYVNKYWNSEWFKKALMEDPTAIVSDVLTVAWIWFAGKAKLNTIQKTALEAEKANIINQVKNATTLEQKSALIKQWIAKSKQIAEKTKQVETATAGMKTAFKYDPYVAVPSLTIKWTVKTLEWWKKLINKAWESLKAQKQAWFQKWIEEIYQAVNPTTKENKAQLRQRVEDLLPYIDEKNPLSNELAQVKWRVDIDKMKALDNMQDYEKNVWVKWTVETNPIIEKIKNKFIEKTSDWVIIDEATAKIANELINKLEEFWPNLKDSDIIKVRRNWDKIIEKNKWFMQSAESNIKWDIFNEANKFFREEIRKSNPKYADYLKQYSKTTSLSDILEATIQRRTGQSQWGYLRRWLENVARVTWVWLWASIWWVPWAIVWDLATEALIKWSQKLTGSSMKLARWKKLILKWNKNGISNNNIRTSSNTPILWEQKQLTKWPWLENKPKPLIKQWKLVSKDLQTNLSKLTKDNVDEIASKITTDSTKLAKVKEVIKQHLIKYWEQFKDYMSELVDKIAEVTWTKLNLLGKEWIWVEKTKLLKKSVDKVSDDLISEANKILDIENSVSKIREKIPDNIRKWWFLNWDKNYKSKLLDIIEWDKKLKNAWLRVMYENYLNTNLWQPKVSFKEFLYKPIKMYRWSTTRKFNTDVFNSYSLDKKIAERFASTKYWEKVNPKNIDIIEIRPIDTLWSYQTTWEAEVLVKRLDKF